MKVLGNILHLANSGKLIVKTTKTPPAGAFVFTNDKNKIGRVGALLEVGRCKIYPDVIKKMLDNPEKTESLPTAPPEGLYLNKIWY